MKMQFNLQNHSLCLTHQRQVVKKCVKGRMLTDLFQFALFQLKTGLGLTFPQFFSKMFDTVILLDVAHTVKSCFKTLSA